MVTNLQKASFGKRIISAIFDGILLSILAVGLAALLSLAFGYNNYMNNVSDAYAKYEAEYNVKFQILSPLTQNLQICTFSPLLITSNVKNYWQYFTFIKEFLKIIFYML